MSARLPGKGRIRVQRIRVLGVAVDVLSMRHLIGVVEGWIDQQERPRWIAFINSFGMSREYGIQNSGPLWNPRICPSPTAIA